MHLPRAKIHTCCLLLCEVLIQGFLDQGLEATRDSASLDVASEERNIMRHYYFELSHVQIADSASSMP